MGEQKRSLLRQLYLPAILCTALWGSAAPCVKRGYELFAVSADAPFSQLVFAGGYDHNWITADQEGSLHPAAQAFSPATGISMEVFSTLPGIQFYSGNYLDGCPVGKEGASYARRWGFCLETQMFPDTPNRPEFPSCVLRAGEVWEHTSVFKFGIV